MNRLLSTWHPPTETHSSRHVVADTYAGITHTVTRSRDHSGRLAYVCDCGQLDCIALMFIETGRQPQEDIPMYRHTVTLQLGSNNSTIRTRLLDLELHGIQVLSWQKRQAGQVVARLKTPLTEAQLSQRLVDLELPVTNHRASIEEIAR